MTAPSVKSVFKIRRADGQFSKGGTIPKFGKIGKAGTSRAALGNHLTLVEDFSKHYTGRFKNLMSDAYRDCVLVQYDIVESSAIPVLDYNTQRKQK